MNGETHYVQHLGSLPPCGNREGSVSTGFWDVTCDQCLHSMPLAIDQFRQARNDLWAALKLSMRTRRSRHGS